MATLDIAVNWVGGAIARPTMRSARPQPGRLLVGLGPAQALGVLSRLYAVCGRAQRACGELALAAAGGVELPAGRHALLARELGAEATQEHLWRLLLDWPRKLGLAAPRQEFAAWYRRIGRDEADWPAALLAHVDAEWLGAGGRALAEWGALEDFDRWHARRGSALAALFAALHAEPAAAAGRGATTTLAVEADCTLAACAEHPWLAALSGAGRWLEAHVAARLVAAVMIVTELAGGQDGVIEMDASSPGLGRGAAVVATARGVLEHDVELVDGRIGAYGIATPTDRNFAADGPYADRVAGLGAADALAAARVADLWALAFDPCVPYAVRASGGPVDA